MKLLVVEGLDGSGKSTVAAELLKQIHPELRAELWREPGSTPMGEAVRGILKSTKMTAKAQALLFFAARAEMLEALQQSSLDVVILDRYWPSTVAYQGYGAPDAVPKLVDLLVDNVVLDYDTDFHTEMYFIDTPTAVCAERTRARGETDVIEDATKNRLEQLRKGYLTCDMTRITPLDGEPATAIALRIVDHHNRTLPRQRLFRDER